MAVPLTSRRQSNLNDPPATSANALKHPTRHHPARSGGQLPRQSPFTGGVAAVPLTSRRQSNLNDPPATSSNALKRPTRHHPARNRDQPPRQSPFTGIAAATLTSRRQGNRLLSACPLRDHLVPAGPRPWIVLETNALAATFQESISEKHSHQRHARKPPIPS